MFKRVSRALLVPAVMVSAFFMVSCAGEDGEDGAQGAAGTNGENGAGCSIVTEGAPEGSEFGVKCGEGAVQWVMNGEQGPAGLPEGCTAVTENVPEYYDLGIQCSGQEIIWLADASSGFNANSLTIQPGKTQTELGFNWYSTDGTKTIVTLYKDDGTKVDDFEGEVAPGLNKNIYHKVTVTGLEADTKYKYSVSNNGEDWSREYNFKTASTGNFRFALTGDTQLNNGMSQDPQAFYSAYPVAWGWAQTIANMEKEGVAFIVSAGDQVDRNNEDQNTENEYIGLFAPPQMKKIPFAPVRGNHEENSILLNHHYNLPNEQEGNAAYTGNKPATNYYFLYNNVLFVGLNTSNYPNSKTAAEPYIADYKATIQAAKSANSGKYDWLVVWHHKSTASLSGHVEDSDVAYYVLAGFQELMTDEEVDIVFAGHDHVYVRSKPMSGNHPYEAGVNDDYKTTYFTVNTGSGLKYYPPAPWGNETTDYPFFNQEIEKTVDMDAQFSAGHATRCRVCADDAETCVSGACADVAVGESVYFPASVDKFESGAYSYSQTQKPGWSIIDVTPGAFTIKSYELGNATPIDEAVITKN